MRVFVGSDPVTGQPRQVTRARKGTTKQTDTALAALVAEVVSGGAPLVGATTLREYLDPWLDHITPTRSPTTVRGYRFKVKRITAKLGHLQLARLTAHQLARAGREWLDEGLDPSSVQGLDRVLSAALRRAVKWGLVPTAVTGRRTRSRRRRLPRRVVGRRQTRCDKQSLTDWPGRAG